MDEDTFWGDKNVETSPLKSLKLSIGTCASQIVHKRRIHPWTLFQALSQHFEALKPSFLRRKITFEARLMKTHKMHE